MDPVVQHYSLNSSVGKWTLRSAIFASSMAFIDSTALNVILPSLQSTLEAEATDLFWVLNSYLLMLAAIIVVAGSLGDKIGRVRVFKWGILLFTVSSLLCGFSPNIKMLIAARTLQGFGGALMIPGSLAIISAVFPKEEKGKAIGSWSAATTIVTICGPLLGGLLADAGLWRFIFFINLPIGVISFLMLHFKVPESLDPNAAKIDWLGAILLTVSLSLLTFGFLQIPEQGIRHWSVIISILLGFSLMVVFILTENRINHPMIPMTLFKNRIFAGVNLLSFLLYAALGGIIFFLSLNIIQIQKYSQFQAGLTFLPFTVLMVLTGKKMGALTDKFGARRFLILGPFLSGVGILGLSLVGETGGPSDYWTTYFPPFLLFAGGMALTVVPLTTSVMTSVTEEQSGIASGINNSVTRISATMINAIVGAFSIYLFTNFVMQGVDTIKLPLSIRGQILNETIKLGEAKVPAMVSSLEQIKDIKAIYKASFISTYQWVGIICSILAFLSSVTAIFMVKEKNTNG